jgi:hypothetical protein
MPCKSPQDEFFFEVYKNSEGLVSNNACTILMHHHVPSKITQKHGRCQRGNSKLS